MMDGNGAIGVVAIAIVGGRRRNVLNLSTIFVVDVKVVLYL